MRGSDVKRLGDEELMTLMGRGNAAAFEAVYDRHGTAAFSLARRIVGESRAAEDVTQEAFLSLWRSGHRYDQARGSVRGWIHSRRPDHNYGAIILPADRAFGNLLGYFGYSKPGDPDLQGALIDLAGYPCDRPPATQWRHSRRRHGPGSQWGSPHQRRRCESGSRPRPPTGRGADSGGHRRLLPQPDRACRR